MTNTSVSLSPDGSHAAVGRSIDGNPDIWLFDVDRGRPLRLTSDPAIQITVVVNWTRRARDAAVP